MNSICVFCGSSSGTEAAFEQVAYQLGKTLAEQGIRLIYGGADVGLMGAVANGALENGGEVVGVLPHFLKDLEVGHASLTELVLVDSMHERKTKMSELCDGVIALPGGFGTTEELFEMLTWGQLGLHDKPIALLNVNGFYNPLIEFVGRMQTSGFLKKVNQDMLLVGGTVDEVLVLMGDYVAPTEGKWIDRLGDGSAFT